MVADGGSAAASRLFSRNSKALAAFPQALAADAEFLGQFRFGHAVLVFHDETGEIILQ